MLLASAGASIIALITLAKISREVEELHTLLSALAKLHRAELQKIGEKLGVGDPKEPPAGTGDIQWKV